ncbi:MAG: hypothetical protein ACOVO1_06325, partial [Chitinophagaceae bacterium]
LTGGTLNQGANTKIVVERSILSKRAWRLIAAPLTGNGLSYSTSKQSVQYQWQNHQTSPLNTLGGTGFGTNIYGPQGTANGFDDTRPNASMLRWNYAAQNWSNVTNTTTEPQFGNATSGSTTDWSSASNYTAIPFFLFARGDKTITTTTGSNAGRLRAVGRLLTGQQVFNYPGVSDFNTKYVASANPYAAPIDFENFRAGFSSNLDNTTFYFWDPSLNNFGTFGGWVQVVRNGDGSYTSTMGSGFGTTYSGSNPNPRIVQSGTAFLLKPITNNNATSVTYQESHKVSTVNAATNGAGTSTTDILNVVLLNETSKPLDGAIARFGAGYNKGFVEPYEDYIKLEQSNETVSFRNTNKKLGVESRGYIQQTDTLFVNLERTSAGTNYNFSINPSNFDATVLDAKLVDKFLNTESPISLSSKTTVPFSVTATTGSNAADRFMIVFRGTGA